MFAVYHLPSDIFTSPMQHTCTLRMCVSSCPPTIKACQLQRGGHHKNQLNHLTWEVNGGMNDSCSHRLIFVKFVLFEFHTKVCEDVHWQVLMPVSRFLNCAATIDHIPSCSGRSGVCSQSVGTPSWVLLWLLSVHPAKGKSGAFTETTVTSFPNHIIHHS